MKTKTVGVRAAGKMRVSAAPEEPGERWVEEEAGLAGVPCGGEGPAGVVAVAELLGGVEPALDVEDLVVAAGVAVEDEGEDCEEGGETEECADGEGGEPAVGEIRLGAAGHDLLCHCGDGQLLAEGKAKGEGRSRSLRDDS